MNKSEKIQFIVNSFGASMMIIVAIAVVVKSMEIFIADKKEMPTFYYFHLGSHCANESKTI